MTRASRIGLAFALAAAAAPLAAQDPGAFWRREMINLQRAMHDPSTSSRVQSIWFELVENTGRMYPVFPAQQFSMGQALPNGAILLDLSIAGNEYEEVTAFWLAHEYAHQVLGHTALHATRLGQWMTAMAGTTQEDAADRWAGVFLSDYGYEIDPVLDFLCSLPAGPRGDSHSDGPTRAWNVAESFGDGEPPCGEERYEETYDIVIRMWGEYEGDAMSMDLVIDGEYVGTLDNIDGNEELDVWEISEGDHSYTLEDITLYGPYGVVDRGGTCSGTFTVYDSSTMDVSLRGDGYGTLYCRIN